MAKVDDQIHSFHMRSSNAPPPPPPSVYCVACIFHQVKSFDLEKRDELNMWMCIGYFVKGFAIAANRSRTIL